MATPFTFVWAVRCHRESFVDRAWYVYESGVDVPRSFVEEIGKELVKLGYIDISIYAVHSIPV